MANDKTPKKSFSVQVTEEFPTHKKELVIRAKTQIGAFCIPLEEVPQLIKDLNHVKIKNNL